MLRHALGLAVSLQEGSMVSEKHAWLVNKRCHG